MVTLALGGGKRGGTLENATERNINSNSIINELYLKGNVEDNRYLFF